MSDNNFKYEMLTDFIPRVKAMLSKEEEHLDFLKQHLNLYKEKKFSLFKKVAWPTELEVIELEHMIDYSQQMVDHLKKRLQEYQDYVK